MMFGASADTIPYALGIVEARQHKPLLLGLLCGIVTIPLGCLIGGLVLQLPLGALLMNLLPLVLFSVAFGPLEGILIGFAFGLLQLLLDLLRCHTREFLGQIIFQSLVHFIFKAITNKIIDHLADTIFIITQPLFSIINQMLGKFNCC